MRNFRPLRSRTESGFTMVELMIAVALLGIVLSWIVSLFMIGWKNWKVNFDTLTAQQGARRAMSIMVQAIREGRTGAVVIDKPANGPNFSRITFTDGRWRGWVFYQNGSKLMGVVPLVQGPNASTTQFLADNVQAVFFTFPSFSDQGLIDVGLTIRKYPFQGANRPVVIQLVERVMLRNQ